MPATTDADLNGTGTNTQGTGLMARHIPFLMDKLHLKLSNTYHRKRFQQSTPFVPSGVVNEKLCGLA